MADPYAEFAQDCKELADGLRRLPSEVRRALAKDMKDEVAAPLARKIGAAARGPWAKVLDPGTKARASADPKIVVGGANPKVRGGAGPRDLVFGTEFGGGGRRKQQRSRRGRTFTRVSTNQFANNKHPFIYDTLRENGDWAVEKVADIVEETLDREIGHG